MKNIKVNTDATIETVVTYTQEQIGAMKAESDAKIANILQSIEQHSSFIADENARLAVEQAHNDTIASWITVSAPVVEALEVEAKRVESVRLAEEAKNAPVVEEVAPIVEEVTETL